MLFNYGYSNPALELRNTGYNSLHFAFLVYRKEVFALRVLHRQTHRGYYSFTREHMVTEEAAVISAAAGAGDAEVWLAVVLAGAEHRAALPGGVVDLVLQPLHGQPALVLGRPELRPRRRRRRVPALLLAAGGRGRRRPVRGRREGALGLCTLRAGHYCWWVISAALHCQSESRAVVVLVARLLFFLPPRTSLCLTTRVVCVCEPVGYVATATGTWLAATWDQKMRGWHTCLLQGLHYSLWIWSRPIRDHNESSVFA